MGVSGRDSRGIAFAKLPSGSWGVATTVTKLIYFKNDGGLKYSPEILVDDSFGQANLGAHEIGNVAAPRPSWPKDARYDDFSFILEALAMGSPAAVTLSNSATGQTASFKHVIDVAPSIDGLAATFAIDKSLYVEELTSAKVMGFELEYAEGGVVRQTFKLLGSKTTISSAVNALAAITGASTTGLTNRVQQKQGVFRMNLFSGVTLAATDRFQAEKIKFIFERPQDAPMVDGQDYVAEPADDGAPVYRLEVTFPRMTAATSRSLQAALTTAVAWKGDWTFTGTSINATDFLTLKLEFPYMQVSDFEAPLQGLNQVKPRAIFELRQASTSPSGLPFLQPFRLTRITASSANAFA